MGSPRTMPPLIDTNASEPGSVVLTPNASVDAKDAGTIKGKSLTRLDMDLAASVRKLEEVQRKRYEARLGTGESQSRRGSGDSSDGMSGNENGKGQGDKGKARDGERMGPPALPVTIHAPTPPRMSRMPSLSQISSHLHIPSPSTPSASHNFSPARAIPITSLPLPSSDGSAPSPLTAGAGFAMSPSGRLRLPASAMQRSRSGSGSGPAGGAGGGVMTLKSLEMLRSGSVPVQSSSTLGSSIGPSGGGGVNGSATGASSVLGLCAGSDAGASIVSSPVASPTSMGSGMADRKGSGASEHQSPGRTAEVSTWRGKTAVQDGAASVPAPSGSLEGAGKAKIDTSQPYKLKHAWTLYYDAKGYKPDIAQSAAKDGGTGLGEYEQSLLHIGTIDTVQGFAQHMTSLRTPSRIPKNANYHLFKSPIRPMWEDPCNSSGGKWVVLFRSCPHLLDWAWANLTMGLIGEMLDGGDEVTGIVGSCRPKMDRIQIWTRQRGLDKDGKEVGEMVQRLNALGKRVWEMMRLEGEVENVSIEFQYNDSNVHPPAGTFFHVPFSGRSFSSTHSAASSTKSISTSTLSTLNLPPTPMSMSTTSRPASRGPSGTYHPSGTPILGAAMSPKAYTPHLPNTTSPLQQSTRFDNTPTGSPSLASSASFGAAGALMTAKHTLPRPPDLKTVNAGFTRSASTKTGADSPGLAGTPLLSSRALAAAGGLSSLPPTPSAAVTAAAHAKLDASSGGAQGMKRTGSGQGSAAFAGPMGGALGLGLRSAR